MVISLMTYKMLVVSSERLNGLIAEATRLVQVPHDSSLVLFIARYQWANNREHTRDVDESRSLLGTLNPLLRRRRRHRRRCR